MGRFAMFGGQSRQQVLRRPRLHLSHRESRRLFAPLDSSGRFAPTRDEGGTMNRREFLRKAGLTGAGFAVAPFARNLSHAPSTVETAPCLWGAWAEPQGQQKARDALLALEQMVGRQMAVHRNY